MKVKIGDKIYDPDQEPILLILTEEDKKNIAEMDPGANKFLMFPDNMTDEEAEKFLKV